MRVDELKKSAADFNISIDSAIKMRIRYLQSLLALWCSYIEEQTDDIPESDMMSIIGELSTLRRYQERLRAGIKMKDGITDDMIEQARNYPIDQVVEFQRGVTIAFCHDDKKPSLTWHKAKNRATCFPCGKSYSALDILMERDKMSFIDAVKYLNN